MKAALGTLTGIVVSVGMAGTATAAAATCNTWTQEATNLGTQFAELSGVSVASADEAWAVGTSFETSTSAGVIERWNGTWSVVRQDANVALSAVTSFGVADAVAVGSTSSAPSHPVVDMWNGSHWTLAVLPIADARFNAVSGSSPSDVWAVGSYGTGAAAQESKALLEHWNGSTWTQFSVPDHLLSDMVQVAAVATDNVYALSFRHCCTRFVWHFDGTAWTAMSTLQLGSSPLPQAIAATSSGLWYAPRGATGQNSYQVQQWTGSAWRPVFSRYYANVESMTAGPDDSVWTAGEARGTKDVYVADDGHAVTTPAIGGLMTAIATGFGRGIAVGESYSGPIILGGCVS
jgi:hypothetical protein